MPNYQAAQEAKGAVVTRLIADPRVVGVGISGPDGHYVIKVNLLNADDVPDLPDEVMGVRVVTEVVGRISAQTA